MTPEGIVQEAIKNLRVCFRQSTNNLKLRKENIPYLIVLWPNKNIRIQNYTLQGDSNINIDVPLGQFLTEDIIANNPIQNIINMVISTIVEAIEEAEEQAIEESNENEKEKE